MLKSLPPREWVKRKIASKTYRSTTGCLRWLGAESRGHAQLKYKRQHFYVARLVLYAYTEFDPNSSQLALHNCGVGDCVEIGHLRPGDYSDNMKDKIKHGNHHELNKTHCPRGHEYNKKNTYIGWNKWRQCRVCGRDKARNRRQRIA